MKYVLTRFRKSCADEFYLTSWKIWEQPVWNRLLFLTKWAFEQYKQADIKDPIQMSFGSNQWLTFTDVNDWLRCITESPVSATKYKVVKEVFQDMDQFGPQETFSEVYYGICGTLNIPSEEM